MDIPTCSGLSEWQLSTHYRRNRSGSFRPIADIGEHWDDAGVEHPTKAFSKAVLHGTLAGGLPPMLMTLPIAIGDYIDPISGGRSLLKDIYLAGMPIWISFTLVLVTSIIVGLPVHFIIQKQRIASETLYLLAGSLAGFLVPLAVLFAIGAVAGFWMAGLGAFSGVMTARSWSKSLGLHAARVQRTA